MDLCKFHVFILLHLGVEKFLVWDSDPTLGKHSFSSVTAICILIDIGVSRGRVLYFFYWLPNFFITSSPQHCFNYIFLHFLCILYLRYTKLYAWRKMTDNNGDSIFFLCIAYDILKWYIFLLATYSKDPVTHI